MLALIAAAALFQAQSGYYAGTFEFGERYRAVDVAWSQCTSADLKRAAIPDIDRAMAEWRSGKLSEASRALDEAEAHLSARQVQPGDAVSLRFTPACVEPGAKANLKVSWAYQPSEVKTVTLSVAGRRVGLVPGRTLTLQINPLLSNPELKLTPETGYLIPANVGGELRTVYISIVKNANNRIAELQTSKNMAAQWLAKRLAQAIEKPQNEWQETPVIEWLFLAERLDDGQTSLDKVEAMPYVQHRGTVFRVAVPSMASATEPTPVVVAFSDSAANEDWWFEAYGRGAAVREALKRDWCFVSVRPGGERALENVLDWLKRIRGVKVGVTFGLSHGTGSKTVIAAFAAANTEVAMLAPLQGTEPLRAAGRRSYVAIGKQDHLIGSSWVQILKGDVGVTCVEFDPCERWMIGTEAIGKAYEFFENSLGP